MKITYTLDMTPEEYKVGVQFLRFVVTKLFSSRQAVWPLPDMPDVSEMPDLSAVEEAAADVSPDQFDPPPQEGKVKIQLKLNGEDETLYVSPETLEKGRSAFNQLVADWSVGFGSDNEPDRAPIMEAHAQSDVAGPVLAYVAWKGGITRAIQACGGLDPKTMRNLALHMTQVASLLHPDLADLLEARNPLKGL